MHVYITTEFTKEDTRSKEYTQFSIEFGLCAASLMTMALGLAGFTGDTAGDKAVVMVVKVVVVVSDLRDWTVAWRFRSFLTCTYL